MYPQLCRTTKSVTRVDEMKGPGYEDRNVPCCYFAPALPILLCVVSVKCWDSANQGLWSDDVTSKFTRQSPS